MYLLVNDLNDIRKLCGHMSLPMLLKGVQIPQERKSEENISQQINLLLNNNIIQQVFKYLQYSDIFNYDIYISDREKEKISVMELSTKIFMMCYIL